jgi:hypothetical protein
LYGQRQSLAEDQGCGTNFGGDADECGPIYKRLDRLYVGGSEPESFEAVCSAFPIDVFVAKDTDPVWRDRASWVWKRPAIFENEFVRMIPCKGQGDVVTPRERPHREELDTGRTGLRSGTGGH